MSVYQFFDLAPVHREMRSEVLEGLLAPQKVLSPKYFYDEYGSQLFDAITRLPEYYPTRTETALFETHSREIGERFSGAVTLIEYGSGSSRKIRALLEGLHPAAYVPLDISGEHLETSAKTLQADYDWLDIYAVCADYTQQISLPDAIPLNQPMAFFPGSSIGNFTPSDAQQFLARVRTLVGDDGKLLIGVDRKKSRTLLEAAYNDAQGVTAQFNLNVLTHLNRELDANFDAQKFAHRAVYNETEGSIQMFLESLEAQAVVVAGTTIEFARGEQVHTENSYKYGPTEFLELASKAGWESEMHLTDDAELFSVFLLRAV